MSASEAVALLDVKKSTLYTYVSRGLVRRAPGPAPRTSVYARSDIERLRARSDARSGHGAVASDALRFGQPVVDSSITQIVEGSLRYRGHDAIALAKHATFEEVADLLWEDDKPWPERLKPMKSGKAAAALGPVERMVAVTMKAASRYPLRHGVSRAAEFSMARELILLLVGGTGEGGVAAGLRARFGLRRGTERALDVGLILSADHELTSSAFASRVAASAGAGLHASVAAGLATLSGVRHGGACDRIDALLVQMEQDSAEVSRRLSLGESVPGFGHPLYPNGDPRGRALIDLARARGSSTSLAPAESALRAMRSADRGEPSVDFGLCMVTRALGMPRGSAGELFALGRIAGLVAHIAEQKQQGFMIRPRARAL